ncbi:MAG: hypothetical protein EZS28_002888 [Streblomastix strix]|uniref:Uncharacterized protein n=1 Tax=Streblomastix strix TaxID=222440 RepID=A0A5J4X3M9_9EUKA|nr:MAG: hypothetical protein EZS28_002888 [Streblomastix strix]
MTNPCEEDEDELAYCYLRLIDYVTDTNRTDLKVEYLFSLQKLHSLLEHNAEAGECLIQISNEYQFSDVVLPAISGCFKQESMKERKKAVVSKAVDYFSKINQPVTGPRNNISGYGGESVVLCGLLMDSESQRESDTKTGSMGGRGSSDDQSNILTTTESVGINSNDRSSSVSSSDSQSVNRTGSISSTRSQSSSISGNSANPSISGSSQSSFCQIPFDVENNEKMQYIIVTDNMEPVPEDLYEQIRGKYENAIIYTSQPTYENAGPPKRTTQLTPEQKLHEMMFAKKSYFASTQANVTSLYGSKIPALQQYWITHTFVRVEEPLPTICRRVVAVSADVVQNPPIQNIIQRLHEQTEVLLNIIASLQNSKPQTKLQDQKIQNEGEEKDQDVVSKSGMVSPQSMQQTQKDLKELGIDQKLALPIMTTIITDKQIIQAYTDDSFLNRAPKSLFRNKLPDLFIALQNDIGAAGECMNCQAKLTDKKAEIMAYCNIKQDYDTLVSDLNKKLKSIANQ